MASFLLEIGLEEIPARMIALAEEELRMRVRQLLDRERLATFIGSNIWEDGTRLENGSPVPAGLKVDGEYVIRSFSTPRRLAVLVKDVRLKQEDSKEQLIGPSWKVAFKDGEPSPAATAFAKKAGVAIEALQKLSNAKGEYVCAYVDRPGRTATEILAAELPKEILSVYWAKNMYWRAGKPERFVRPLRWLVALLDSTIVPLEIAGIAAGNSSRGHRVLHGDAPVIIPAAAGYAEAIEKAKVVVEVSRRRHIIRKALDAATRAVPGARWREDEALVETVVHLTEWPSVILGKFEPEYLSLPEEVLVTVMRDHQKYFAVEDANGKLAPHFLAVLNTEADAEGAAIIRHGNERVLRSRFKDAQFFWDFDQKTPLAARTESLQHVTFQKELGSYAWKTDNNEQIAKRLFEFYERASPNPTENTRIFNALQTAIRLAKADLTTELVKEFTELQGVIGGLYARAQGLGDRVAQAIYDQYTPASTDDPIPLTVEGQLLGMADRIQTIVAMFGIGMAPTGSKDPFALRRAGNAIVKILAESELSLTLGDVLVATSDHSTPEREQAFAFLADRLAFYLKEVRGFSYDVVNAVLAAGYNDVRDAISRAQALTAVRGSDDFAAISAAFKRIKNILRQATEKGYSFSYGSSAPLADEALRLKAAADAIVGDVARLRQNRNYAEALSLIATLRPVVDTFFDKVMVLDANPDLRAANLGLIDEVLRNFSTIADFSEIVTS